MKKKLSLQKKAKSQIYEINLLISILENYYISEKHANKINDILKASLKHKYLDLSYCKICNEILAIMFPLICELDIKELDLSHNQIDANGIVAIAESLKQNKSLVKLDLSYNNINLTKVAILAETLKVNTSLKELNLSYNIGSDQYLLLKRCTFYYN